MDPRQLSDVNVITIGLAIGLAALLLRKARGAAAKRPKRRDTSPDGPVDHGLGVTIWASIGSIDVLFDGDGDGDGDGGDGGGDGGD